MWDSIVCDRTLGLSERPVIKNLVIACHSGGGALMRDLVGTLGGHDLKLRECWGFDCLYDKGDATFWHKWVRKTGHRIYIVHGKDTINESVKLYLMAQGKADSRGLASPGIKEDKIEVTPAYSPYHRASPMYGPLVEVKFDLGSVDDAMGMPSAGGKRDIVSTAIANLKRNYSWPVSAGSLHYFTTALFSSRLKHTNFP